MQKILPNIDSPEDLKKLNINEMNNLALEIRQFLVESLAKTGGHLASNLGAVELSLALHYYLNSPEDKIVWDVGHQAYTHKIVTGRKDCFGSLRQKGGISGYPKCSESEHDIIETGHSGTSISSALGLALARDHQHVNNEIYAVIGDGAMTGGMAFEALNHAGHLKTNMKVVLNDNEMSISGNVGALSHYLSNLRSDPTVNRLKEDIEFIINRIPKIGSSVSKTIERIKNGLKYVFISGILFEEMGFKYLGPIDGHNIQELVSTFEKAGNLDGPVLIHTITKKGKGYQPAEDQPSKYHGVSQFDIKSGESIAKKQKPTYSQIFGQTMLKMAEERSDLVGITAAMPAGTGLQIFADKYPERTYDVGIAEQHAVTLAAGLARGGLRPVVALYSTFLQRAYDQVIHDLCIQKLPVTLAIDRAGIVGNDGETHQGVFDFSFLRAIPNMVIMAPRDENEQQHMLYTALNHPGPAAVRYPRGEVKGVSLDDQLINMEIAKAETLKKGEELLVLAIGSTVYPALEAAEILDKNGINTGVIDARFVKPLDEELILDALNNYKKVLIVEEQALAGGFGSAVLELANKNNLNTTNIYLLGISDEFVRHGDMGEMRADYQLDTKGILQKANEIFAAGLEVESLWPAKSD